MLVAEGKESIGHWGGYEDVAVEWPQTPDQFKSPDGYFLIVYMDALPLGCAGYVQSESDEVTIKYLYVRQGMRGKGAGRALIKALIYEAESEGFRWIRALLHRQSIHAQQLLRDLDFVSIGQDKDHFIVERSLTPKRGFEKHPPPVREHRTKAKGKAHA